MSVIIAQMPNNRRHLATCRDHRIIASGLNNLQPSAPARILIADDSQPVRRRLRRLLESQLDGAVVEEAEDGREAVDKTIHFSPDIAILDVAMPVLNGLLATEQISAIRPDLPILVHTMYATPQIESEMRRRGAMAVVPKDDVRLLLWLVGRLS